MKQKPKYTVKYTFAVIAYKLQEFETWKWSWVKDKSVSDTKYSFIVNEIKYIYVASDDRLRGTVVHGLVELAEAKFHKNYRKIISEKQLNY